VHGGGALKVGRMKLGAVVPPIDVIDHANSHLYLMGSLGARRWSKKTFSLLNAFGSHNIDC
jgi:hypothetical protein